MRDLDAPIRALVDAAPPLTEEQRSRLAAILAPAAPKATARWKPALRREAVAA